MWCKKIRSQLYYFGPWDDPDGALKKYLEQKDDLHAGRKPRTDPAALTVRELANIFLNAKRSLVDEGRLSSLTWGDYKSACDEAVAAFGETRLVSDLRPSDFAGLRKQMARKWAYNRCASPSSSSAVCSSTLTMLTPRRPGGFATPRRL